MSETLTQFGTSFQSNNNYVTEAGDVENWRGGFNKEEMAQNLQEGLEFLEGLKIK